ncbi:MAG: hypothetical protein L3J13_00600 [Devosiaceae bacterium]|nr:hypothetical protein [Devosiaceae bacterium]
MEQNDSISWRQLQYEKLNRRNTVISVLRWAVPGIGLLVAGFLIFQIILTNLANDYGISGLRIEQDQVVIDKPRYGGITEAGTRYNIEAEVARVQTSASNIVELEQATITIEQSDGYQMVARASNARLDLTKQTITIPGILNSTDSKGVRGVFLDSTIDWTTQTLNTRGAVTLEFEDGAIINAQSLVYDARTSNWDFTKAVYVVAGDGGVN